MLFEFLSYGGCLESQGNLPAQQFTGQRLDSTGLYYYGARYYDPTIGRFISPDPIIQNFTNPQNFNRYSYCLNNPLKYIDPSGNIVDIYGINPAEISGWSAEEDYYYSMYLNANSDAQTMLGAWQTLAPVAPELTQELITSEYVIPIRRGNAKR